LQIGLVSEGTPLISNLDVWSNISLILQYHRNIPWRQAKDMVEDWLNRLNMKSISEKRNSALTDEERFCAMALRAAMVENSIIVLDRPFYIVSNLRNSEFIIETLHKLDDLIAEARIFDYTWENDRYGVLG
jgi:ABC-type lipoprotein export system ATPase subunit